MPRHASNQPTEVELEILQTLWRRELATAREIHDSISKNRETNYSTTVKMLSVMFDKGLVKRDDSTRPMKFRAAKTQKKTQSKLLKTLTQKAYNGAVGSLVMQALSSKKATKKELIEIRELIEKLEKEQE
jgi:predicted transcriptional regulator